MPIGAILLLTAASIYAKQKGVPVKDALEELNPCLHISYYCNNSTAAVDDSAQELPQNYGYYSDLRCCSSSSNSSVGTTTSSTSSFVR